MEFPFLQDIVIILGLAVFIILIFFRFRIPPLIGFLITGIIAGPHGLSLIEATEEVKVLAEIGVIFLLFVAGIEFSLKTLLKTSRTIFLGGVLQVAGTIGVITLVSLLFGLKSNEALFMGFLLCMSSTAIVMKMVRDREEIDSPHGGISIAVLIFQDLVVVPMILVTPLLAGVSENILESILFLVFKIALLILFVILVSRYFLPAILSAVVKSKSRELFLLTIVVLCFATAWLTSYIGLSLALGAFFAGLIISESDYDQQASAYILPFHELFVSFFFISVGMLLDFSFFMENILSIHLFALGVMCLKFLIIFIAVLLLRYPIRTVLLTSFYLLQVGEFAFVLSIVGLEQGLLTSGSYQYFLAISIISMGATPFLINRSGEMADFLLKWVVTRNILQKFNPEQKTEKAVRSTRQNDHLVIIGFGINGENVSRAAREAEIPYIIIELDPDRWSKAKQKNEPVVFGDAGDELILKFVNIKDARVVVIAISDPPSTKKIVKAVRRNSDKTFIIVRTRYIKEINEYLKIGADEIIPEEFETSIEIFAHVLRQYLIPVNEIKEFSNRIRESRYAMLRNQETDPQLRRTRPLSLHEVDIVTLKVHSKKKNLAGKTVFECDFDAADLSVVGIKRNESFLLKITPDTVIEEGDLLYLFGKSEAISKALDL